jgi:hypothetical protein
MPKTEVKVFDRADETRPFHGHGHADVIHIAGRPVARGVFEPGWRWSHDIKPIAGTESCQVSHLGYVLEGAMRVEMDDGARQDINAGQVVAIPPGHDAAVIGDRPCVLLDFGEIEKYATRP